MSDPQLTDDERDLVEHLTEIEEDENAVLDVIPNLSSAALHSFCCHYNWDSDLAPLSLALDQPQCDRATALAIYWLSEPDAWAGQTSVKDWQQETFDIFKKAENCLLADNFAERNIDFDIRHEMGGIDAYWDSVAENAHIPQILKPLPLDRPAFDGTPCGEALRGQVLEKIQPRAAGAIFVFSGGTSIAHPSYRTLYREAQGFGSDVPIDYSDHPSLGARVESVAHAAEGSIKIVFERGLAIEGDDVIVQLPGTR